MTGSPVVPEGRRRATDKPCGVGRALALLTDDNGTGRGTALDFLERAGASQRVVSVMRSAIAAGTTSDPTWGGALDQSSDIIGSFIESLASESIFARAISGGMNAVPVGQRASVVTVALNASIVAEGQAKALTRLTLAAPTLERRKAMAIIVMTQELFRSVSPAAVQLFENELRKGVAKAIDGEMLSVIVDGSTPVLTSNGTSATSVRDDIVMLLDAVNTVGAGSLIFGMAPDVANRAAVHDDGKGLMTPTGGSFYGVDTIVTNGLDAGEMVLVDAGGLAGSMDTMELRQFRNSTLQFSDSPDSPATASTVILSLFQHNLLGMVAEAFFGVERIRDTAVAKLTGISWGGSVDSPA